MTKRALFNALKPILLMILNLITKEAFDLVLEIVERVGALDLTNNEKREEALRVATILLKASGHNLKDSVVNLLIELAVSKLKSN